MKQFKKLIVRLNKEDKRVLQELLIKTDGFDSKTLAILRERPATERESLIYNTGHGSHLKF